MILTPFLMDLAKVVHGIREDWPLPSIHRALCQCEGRSEQDIALAAVRVAADPDTKAPARLTMPGPWWLPVDNTDRRPHLAEVRMPPRYEREQIRAVPPPPALIAQTRAQLRAARPTTEEPRNA